MYYERMELSLPPALEAKLSQLAAQRGCETQALIREAIELLVESDDWFRKEVHKGLAAADRGEFVEHADVRRLIDTRYPADAHQVD
jgi:predicted transcriptional regulator